MHDLEVEKNDLIGDPDKLLVIFREMIQMCLWYVHTSFQCLHYFIHYLS